MGASSSKLAQGEDPLIREFWRMLGCLNLDDEVQPASSTRLPCGDEIAVSHAEWQRDSDEHIEGVIVSFFLYFPCFLRRGLVVRRGLAALALTNQGPQGFHIFVTLHNSPSMTLTIPVPGDKRERRSQSLGGGGPGR